MANTITNVILKPIFTEKTESFKFGDKKKYYFIVQLHANKAQIRSAFISIYMTEPEAINIIRRKPALIRTGTRHPGYSKEKKIAIITLKKGISLAMDDEELKNQKKSDKKESGSTMTSSKRVVSEGTSSDDKETKK